VTPSSEPEVDVSMAEPIVKTVVASFPMFKSPELKSPEETYDEGDQDEMPASPLLPIAKFTPTKRTTTRQTTLPPTTVTIPKRSNVATTKVYLKSFQELRNLNLINFTPPPPRGEGGGGKISKARPSRSSVSRFSRLKEP
jgi:hypothetical protein